MFITSERKLTPERTLGTFNFTDEIDLRSRPQFKSDSALDRLTAQYTAKVYSEGNVPCALYHVGRYHLRTLSGFTAFFKQSLRDYKEAWQLDRTLTRVQFWKGYTDEIADFLSTYTVDHQLDSTDAAEIQWMTLRALVSLVAPERVRYSGRFDDFLELEESAYCNYCKLKTTKGN
jgi:hypothetical protein